MRQIPIPGEMKKEVEGQPARVSAQMQKLLKQIAGVNLELPFRKERSASSSRVFAPDLHLYEMKGKEP